MDTEHKHTHTHTHTESYRNVVCASYIWIIPFRQALLQALCFRALKDASDSAHGLIIPSSLFCSSKCEATPSSERLQSVSSLAIIGAGLCIWCFISISEMLESIRHHRHYTNTQNTQKHLNVHVHLYCKRAHMCKIVSKCTQWCMHVSRPSRFHVQ